MCSTNIITYFLGKLGTPSLPFDERSESKCFYIPFFVYILYPTTMYTYIRSIYKYRAI